MAVSTPAVASHFGRAPNSMEASALRRLTREASRVRELTPTGPITTRVASGQEIASRLAEQLEAEDMQEARDEYIALGLFPEDVNLRLLIKNLMAEQVVGFYDPEHQDLVIREDAARGLTRTGISPSLLQGRIAMVHELVHALQDQRLGLRAAMDQERDTDADNALHSLVEGDATLAMLGWVIARAWQPLSVLTTDPDRLRAVQQVAPSGELLLAAPRIVQVSLMAPYLRGLAFCAALHARGGFAAVDRAHAEPPRSMEQVMHPEKFLAGEAPDAISLPDLPSLEAAGFAPVLEDTLGELELGVYLGLGRTTGIDEQAAAGWGGDRLRVYRSPGGLAAAWLTTWDDEDEAREAESAARRAQDAASAEARESQRVVRIGRALLILRGVTPALQPEVLTTLEPTMRSWSAARD